VSRALGAEAEARAAEFLQRKGHRIVARNWCCRGGEIDLVCDDKGTLVFVEVRARASARHGAPVETVGDIKRRRLVRAAAQYLAARGDANVACRFDVVAITGDVIEHFEDAFSTS
jgi:putative endonuclease